MDGDLTGRTVRSLRGHDSGCLYIVLRTEDAYAFLSDGRLKPAERPKKKKIRHVEVLPDEWTVFSEETVKTAANEDLRRALKSLRKRLSI